MKKSLFLFLFLFSSLTFARNCEMWYEDSNLGKVGYFPADAKEKFTNTKSWKRSLKYMNTYLIRANALYFKKNKINDYFLKNKILKILKKYHVKLALDVKGATLTHLNANREKVIYKEIKLINKIESMGTHIDSINFQSALSKSIKTSTHKDKLYTYSIKKRIEDIVSYAEQIHQKYPHIKFGLIDALPTKGYPYKQPYEYLNNEMKAHGLVLNHIILDMPYSIPETNWRGMTWKHVKDIESFIKHTLHIKFGKTFDDSKGGRISNRLFYKNVMKMADRLKKEKVQPDYCVLMSWFQYPDSTIPEDKKYTMMNTFLELSKKLK